MKEVKEVTDAEINQIALDLFNGKIFTDRQVRSEKDLTMVFMPLGLGALAEFTEEQVKDIGMIYEYLDKAGPRSVNGYPMFMSFHFLTKADTDRVFKKYKEIKEAIEQVTGVTNG